MTLKILHSCFLLFCGCSLKPPTAELNSRMIKYKESFFRDDICCSCVFVCFRAGQSSDAATFDLRDLHIQLEQQLSGQAEAQPRSRRKLFSGQYVRHDRQNPDVEEQQIIKLESVRNRDRRHVKKQIVAVQC